MRFDREGRRTVAQFLNGLAVCIVASLALTPLATGTFRPGLAVVAVVVAAICHVVALRFARRRD